MAVKAIFSECPEAYWLDVALILKKEGDWQPCYWIAGPVLEGAIKKAFPGVIVHDGMDAIRAIKPHGCSLLRDIALNQSLLDSLAVHEPIILTMMDRFDPMGIFSYQERTRLYHHQLKYWLSVLEYYKPDVVIFASSPHVVYDYILYILCGLKGIKTIAFAITIEGLFFPIEKFEDIHKPLIELYRESLSNKSQAQLRLSPALDDYFQKVSGTYAEGAPFYYKKFIESIQPQKPLPYIKRKIRAVFKYMRFFFMQAPAHYIKQKGQRFEDSKMSYLKFIWICKFQANKKKRKLETCYNKLAENVSLDKPYIYVGLHYQPECSTSPNGGIFVNQLLMIEMLSMVMPKGWYIYVKEHIFQFRPESLGERSRNEDFYHDLTLLPNVKLVPISVSSFDLIDHSNAVATVTGTVGWEALIREKPTLVFGYSWYRGCEGVFYTPTLELCKEAVMKIQAGYRVDRQRVRLFLYALELTSFRGYVDSSYEKIAGVSSKENAITLARAILSLYKGDNRAIAQDNHAYKED